MRYHRLTDVDPDRRTATCSLCGPVGIRRSGDRWRCRTSANQHKRSAGEAPRSTRQPHRVAVGDRCERCGFVAEDPRLLDVHHRDGDHGNNDPANLATLCPICHRREHFGL